MQKMLLLVVMFAGTVKGFAIVKKSDSNHKPEQVHLSYPGDPTKMNVAWLTQKPVDDKPIVFYGRDPNSLLQTVSATVIPFVDGGDKQKKRFVYKATMTGLLPRTRYYYQVGTFDNTSPVFSFNSFQDGVFEYKVAVYGDLGVEGGVSTEPLVEAAKNGDFDMVIHIGDLAYDLDSKNGDRGDDYMNSIQELTAHIPYMTIAGNHEENQNFLHYRTRFEMPDNSAGIDDNQFYSFNLGPVHFIGLSSEYYGFEMPKEAKTQFQWLQDDLKVATSPWLITYFHRPYYCSNKESDGCSGKVAGLLRAGSGEYEGLEKPLAASGVDLIFTGHEHSYERTFPVFNDEAFPQQLEAYKNAKAPTYILSGAAGCHDMTPEIIKNPKPWSAVRLGEYSYTVLHIHNATHLHIKQISSISGKTVDDFWLTKDPGYRPKQF